VTAGPNQRAAVEVGGGKAHLRGGLVLQVAPEIAGDAGFAQRRQVGPGADFVPEIIAGQGRDAVTEGHGVPQPCHGGVVGVLGNGGAPHAAVRILVHRDAHQVVAELLVGTCLELVGNDTSAYEVDLATDGV